ncbi:MAG: hypothetical protein ACREGL_10830, partial [Alphaproteobacteria bacterium]
MKIVFSRKGFDSALGGSPSPIFADGRAVSLPIPTTSRSSVRFGDVRCVRGSLGALVEQLTRGRVRGNRHCHLDPDLDRDARPRPHGWRPAFG